MFITVVKPQMDFVDWVSHNHENQTHSLPRKCLEIWMDIVGESCPYCECPIEAIEPRELALARFAKEGSLKKIKALLRKGMPDIGYILAIESAQEAGQVEIQRFLEKKINEIRI